ncbi:amidohydrolase family protein [Rhodoferax ferrireducens]|uniref:amidohydrolase family protein n=1 Tax=Rhodoferax ferrireducens TaxID=192843 RepID=UPI001E4D71CA|nr:amidohydrolase family protein [Rhodoferax ferrireducens]
MKIDTHQHFWHYQAQDFPWINAHMPVLQQDRMPADCRSSMQACGIDAVVAVQARGVLDETDFLLGLAAQDPRIVGVLGWADLTGPGLEAQLNHWADHVALRGLRHILQDEPDITTLIGSAAFNRGVASLQKRQLVYDVLVFDRQLPAAVDFCARHDAHWLVLDHVGKPALRDWFSDADVPRRWAAGVRELAAMPHVMCKLSGLVTETNWQQVGVRSMDARVIHACFDQALEAFGPLRLMFGSDWPVCELAAPYASVHRIAQAWATSRLTAQEQEAFWGGNAVQCYGLPLPAAID